MPTMKEACERLGVKESTLRFWRGKGELRMDQILEGKRITYDIPEEEIQRILDERNPVAEPPQGPPQSAALLALVTGQQEAITRRDAVNERLLARIDELLGETARLRDRLEDAQRESQEAAVTIAVLREQLREALRRPWWRR